MSSERVQQQVEGLSNMGKSVETLAHLIQKKGGDMSITRGKEVCLGLSQSPTLLKVGTHGGQKGCREIP